MTRIRTALKLVRVQLDNQAAFLIGCTVSTIGAQLPNMPFYVLQLLFNVANVLIVGSILARDIFGWNSCQSNECCHGHRAKMIDGDGSDFYLDAHQVGSDADEE